MKAHTKKRRKGAGPAEIRVAVPEEHSHDQDNELDTPKRHTFRRHIQTGYGDMILDAQSIT